MALSTGRWSGIAAIVVFGAMSAWLLRGGLGSDQVLISSDALAESLPWSAVVSPDPAANRYLVDQSRIFYPYLQEAARVYRGEADSLWTSRGGGGLPFLGNMTSSLFHPLTALAAVLPVSRVPLVGGLVTLTLSALFTFLFLRRLGLGAAPAMLGGVAFGFGGHQVLWLQYALSHTLLALPLCFWATERLVQDRSRRRVAVLAVSFALLIFGGHPETSWVSALVAGLWALWRLWDSHGRWLVAGTVLLAVALSAVQWMPFLDYALDSRGVVLRSIESGRGHGVGLGLAIIFAGFFAMSFALLRSAGGRGVAKSMLAVVTVAVVVVMARRMGMALSASTVLLPQLYGTPVDGGVFTGAEDFPGLNAAYVGVLPALLMAVGFCLGLGGGFVRFFGLCSLLLWGAAFHLPAAEGLVRTLPGLGQFGPTRLLGPVAFLVACGGAKVLDVLLNPATKPGYREGAARITVFLALGAALGAAVLSVPVEPHGGLTVISTLLEPRPEQIHAGDEPILIRFHLAEAADDLRVTVGGQLLRSGPAAPPPDGSPVSVTFLSQRAEEGVHRLRVEAWRWGRLRVLADQPLVVERAHRLGLRDLAAGLASLAALAVVFSGRRRAAMALAIVVVVVDVLSFGDGYNVASPAERVFPETETERFLRAQPGPFRVFSEGTALPPDTQFAMGVDHLLSYDNIGFQRHYQWLLSVLDMDAFASFSFSRDTVDYAHARFDALDVEFVLTDTGTDLSDLGMELAHQSEARVWRNEGNLGRAWLVGRAEVLDAARRAELEGLDPAEAALVEAPVEDPLGGTGTARVVEHAGSEIRVAVEADGPSLLVLAENRSEGWIASIDGGEPRPTLAANVAWQTVVVPAGSHEVVFSYDPPAFRWGLRLSLGACLLLALMFLLPRHLA